MEKANVKRICSLIIVVYFICVMALSVSYTISHTNHHCTGEDCPICHSIHMAEEVLKTIGAGIAVVAFGFLVQLLFCFHIYLMSFVCNITSSLVSLKVQLNN